MGQVTPYTDPTGQLSQDEINSKNIEAVMIELNRGQDIVPLKLDTYNDGTTNRYMAGYLTNGWGPGKNVGIKASRPGIEVTTAKDNQLSFKDDFSTKTWYDSNGVPNILEGLLPNGKRGIWVSAPGVNVTAANPAVPGQLLFDSSQDTFKIVQTDTVVIPGLGNQTAYATGATGLAVPHPLGYPPAFSAYVLVPVRASNGFPPVSIWNQAFPCVAADPSGMTYNLQCGTDSTNIYFVNFWANNQNAAPVQPFSVTYYLFTTTA